jgi:hypothetical protein
MTSRLAALERDLERTCGEIGADELPPAAATPRPADTSHNVPGGCP